MRSRKVVAFVAVVAGLVSLVMLFLMVLALADVAQGESDLVLEWRVVRIALAVALVFHLTVLVVLFRQLRARRRSDEASPGVA